MHSEGERCDTCWVISAMSPRLLATLNGMLSRYEDGDSFIVHTASPMLHTDVMIWMNAHGMTTVSFDFGVDTADAASFLEELAGDGDRVVVGLRPDPDDDEGEDWQDLYDAYAQARLAAYGFQGWGVQ